MEPLEMKDFRGKKEKKVWSFVVWYTMTNRSSLHILPLHGICTGDRGDDGQKGDVGDMGEQGMKGDEGEKGMKGIRGGVQIL